MKRHAIREIYDAKYKVRDNRRDMILAATRRDHREIIRLSQENERLRADILRKYAIILD